MENFLFWLTTNLERRGGVVHRNDFRRAWQEQPDIVRHKELSRMYDLFSIRDTIARNITSARLVNPECTELKRIAFEIGNAFDRLVTRPGYRRTSVTKTQDFPLQQPNKYKYFAAREYSTHHSNGHSVSKTR